VPDSPEWRPSYYMAISHGFAAAMPNEPSTPEICDRLPCAATRPAPCPASLCSSPICFLSAAGIPEIRITPCPPFREKVSSTLPR
jgi:hypothetical protein